jgi:hypothetical protein
MGIRKLTALLARICASDEQIANTTIGAFDKVIFSKSQFNLFAEFQIKCNEIRKKNNSKNLPFPLLHLSPRLITVSDKDWQLLLSIYEKQCKISINSQVNNSKKIVSKNKSIPDNVSVPSNQTTDKLSQSMHDNISLNLRSINKEIEECSDNNTSRINKNSADSIPDPFETVHHQQDEVKLSQVAQTNVTLQSSISTENITSSTIYDLPILHQSIASHSADDSEWKVKRKGKKHPKTPSAVANVVDMSMSSTTEAVDLTSRNTNNSAADSANSNATYIVEGSHEVDSRGNNHNSIDNLSETERNNSGVINDNSNSNSHACNHDSNCSNNKIKDCASSVASRATMMCSCCKSLDLDWSAMDSIARESLESVSSAHMKCILDMQKQHEATLEDIRESHFYALQTVNLRLFIANSALENEREDREKIIESSVRNILGRMNVTV